MHSSAAMRFALFFTLSVAAWPAFGLDPGSFPSRNFDLTRWKLTLPADRTGGFSGAPQEINAAELGSGYHGPYFFSDPVDGSMVFRVPSDGATGGTSSHPRCELREMLPSSEQHNWTTGSEGGKHTLRATCTLDSDSVGKDGEVCIGQIHAKDPNIPAVMLIYDNRDNQGILRLQVKKKVTEDPAESHRFAPAGLNQPGTHRTRAIHYELTLLSDDSGHVTFSATVNGETWSDIVSNYDANAWKTATFYFKAGSYYTHAVSGCSASVAFQSLFLLPETAGKH